MAGRSGRTITAALAAAIVAALALYLIRGGGEKAPEQAPATEAQAPAGSSARKESPAAPPDAAGLFAPGDVSRRPESP